MDNLSFSYDKVEHYSSSLKLIGGSEVDIRVYSVFGDAEGDIEDEFQIIEYRFDQNVKEELIEFRERAAEFSDYKFFPIIGDYAAPAEATIMIDSDDKVEIAEFAEELIESVHSEIGL